MESYPEKIVTDEIDKILKSRQSQELKATLEGLKKDFKDRLFIFVKISLSFFDGDIVIIQKGTIKEVVEIAEKKIKDKKGIHWADYKVGYLLSVFPEEISYIKKNNLSKKLFLSEGATLDLTQEQKSIVESALFFEINERLWRDLIK